MQAKVALLPDRGIVRVAGEDAEKLLQGVISNDMDILKDRSAIHSALLTPQGKILFEFFVVRNGDGYLLETGADQAAGLAKRLAMYKLRAKVEISDASADYRVMALWDASAGQAEPAAIVYADPRLPALGQRMVAGAAAVPAVNATPDDYHAHRIALGVPEAGKDYVLGDTFPHEAEMDQLGGVSFDKGCFVGQEVVSRMQHRTQVRKRVVPVEAAGAEELRSGAEVMAGTATIGRIGSVAGRRALAFLRLDRAAEALAKGEPLLAEGTPIVVRKPDWARFDLAPAAAETP